MANLHCRRDFLFFVFIILFFNNIPLSAFSEKVNVSERETLGAETPQQYKSFRSVNLFDRSVPISDDYDDYVPMGSLLDAFKGPRRKRRGIQMESGFKPISYVFPEPYSYSTPKTIQPIIPPEINPTENVAFDEEKVVAIRAAPNNFTLRQEEHLFHVSPPEPRLEKYSKDPYLQQAMQNAWQTYGPKYAFRADGLPAPIYGLANYQNGFQQMDSEWDQHVTAVPIPVRNRVILQPGIFNRLLSRYIDFEVNNHEIADFARKVVFGLFVATLIVGWIGLGFYLGFFPFKWLLFTGRSEDAEGKLFERRSDLLAGITDRIFLALDSDWLKKLEERVQMDSDRKWVKTHVHCCILPQSQTKGMADCRVIRRERKLSPYKCLSDLLYSFQFGPSVDVGKDSSNEARSEITT